MRKEQYTSLPYKRSIHLKTHNYQWSASYFITIRALQHQPVFDMPKLFAIVDEQWNKLPKRFPHVHLDEYTIMPDHMHGILHFVTTETTTASLFQVVGAYKSLTTGDWFRYVKTHNVHWEGLLWQKRYYESVLHDAADVEQRRQYIRDNPLRWKTNNPYK